MPTVDDLCRSYLDLKYHFDPAAASAAGLVTHDGRLGSFDADTVRVYLAALKSVAGAMEELDTEDLEDEIDRTALLGEIRSTMYRWEHERPNVRNPSYWLSHLFQALYAVLSRYSAAAANRATPVLERLEAVPAFLETARATLDEPPSVFIDAALIMLGGGGQLIAQVTAAMADEDPSLRERLQAAGTRALESLTRFGVALRDDIEPNPDPLAFAVGEDQFSRRLHYEHALVASAPELWRYGLHLQEETEERLASLAAELGSTPWRELVDRLRGDAPEGDVLDVYRRELDRAHRLVRDRHLVSVPLDPVDVVPTPAFLVSLVPFAAYEPPPIYLPDQHGRFYVTRPDPTLPAEVYVQQLRGHCRYAIPAMVVHEAYPGHHLQLVTAQELASEVRRHVWTPIMVEGWALYCEQLMEEAAEYYATVEERLFRLVNLLWRAVRVVLDVGLHTRGMAPAEAVDYMVEHLPIERSSAEAEVRRYCAWPTYQLCYAVGRREILRLREAYRDVAGEEYSIKRFHDTLLRYGGLPVSLARWGMDLAD
ncbi:MAG: DUF885 domain-containing protein [Gemmatimonadales bacterium]